VILRRAVSAFNEIEEETTMTTLNLRTFARANQDETERRIRRRLKFYGGCAGIVASEFGVSLKRVQNIRDAAGIKIDRSRWPGRTVYSAEIRSAALAEYNRIGTIKGTVRVTGVPEGTLRGWIRARSS
jgi:hypothetical protein